MGSNGSGVFYPHHVPTGLPTLRPYGTTHITSLRVYPHCVPTGLPTSRPYGTRENNDPGVFYPHRVPTGLPTFRPYGTRENNDPGVFYPHRVPTGLGKTTTPVFFRAPLGA
jgi:hypothetical protein